MLDERLNETLFTSLNHAREKIAAWVWDYNTQRPHSSLGYSTPAAFAADLKKQGAASPAHMGDKNDHCASPVGMPSATASRDWFALPHFVAL